MKILVISAAIPFPPFGGGRLRTYHFVRNLRRNHDVTLIGFSYEDERYVSPDIPVPTIAVPWDWPQLYRHMNEHDGELADRAYEFLATETHEPWFASFYDSPLMEETIRRTAAQGFDLVLLEGTDMARFIPALPQGVPKVLDLMDVTALMAKRDAEAVRDREGHQANLEFERTVRFERDAANACDLCLTVSPAEARAAHNLLGVQHVEVIPNGVDAAYFSPSCDESVPDQILFTGMMSYAPNVEAVRYFAKEVLPRIRERLPEAKFHIVGVDPAPGVKELASDSVIVHGRVPDLRPFYSRAAVVVVPLLSGGGTRLKILEAGACGKAIVSTTFGAEGIDVIDGQDILIADDPGSFSFAASSLLGDEEERKRLGKNVRQVALRHEWNEIGLDLDRVITGVCR